MSPIHIRYQNPRALTPHPRNARIHSDAQIAQIAKSIKSFGFNVTPAIK